MASEFFGRRRMCRFYTAGCGNKMVVSVTGPRAVRRPSHTGYVMTCLKWSCLITFHKCYPCFIMGLTFLNNFFIIIIFFLLLFSIFLFYFINIFLFLLLLIFRDLGLLLII